MALAAILFDTGRVRELEGPLAWIVRPYAALIALGVIYASVDVTVDLLSATIVFLAAILVLSFLCITPGPQSDESALPWFDLVLAGAALATGLYLFLNLATITNRISLLDELTQLDMAFGSLLLLLMLEVSRRTTGTGLTAIVLLFFAYNLWGHVLPGAFGHGFIAYDHFLDTVAFTTDGIFGAPLRVCATYAFLFVLFGTILNRAGGGDFFFNLAARATGRSTGGPAKVAVVSSGLYGMISGNPVADCVTTGSVTIPAMKRLGYPAALAAGIEVAASAGGSLAPPVMGAAAFIMAEFTGIPYAQIAVAAILPALLYYFGIFVQVHLSARRYGLRGLTDAEMPTLGRAISDGWTFMIPLAVLVAAIAVGYSASPTALASIAALLVAVMLRKSTRLGPRQIFGALVEATMSMVPVAGACAAAGLIVAAMTMTGLAQKSADLITILTGDNLMLSLFMAAFVTTALGLGLPTSTSYILGAVLTAPVVMRYGASQLAAHMFILYYAVLSAVSPPVAVAAYAAAAIAKAGPMAISIQATRFCIVAFVVPFAFVFHESLLLRGGPIDVAGALAAAAAGVILLGIGVEGYLHRPLGTAARALFALGGATFFGPSPLLMAAGAAAAAAGYLLYRFAPAPAPDAPS